MGVEEGGLRGALMRARSELEGAVIFGVGTNGTGCACVGPLKHAAACTACTPPLAPASSPHSLRLALKAR